MSVTTAMDSIQMGNPICVRWQRPPSLVAPAERQQPVRLARQSESTGWEERELLLHTLLHNLSQQQHGCYYVMMLMMSSTKNNKVTVLKTNN